MEKQNLRSIVDIRNIPFIQGVLSEPATTNLDRLNHIWAEAEAKKLGLKIDPTNPPLQASRFTRDPKIISTRMAQVTAENH